MKAFFIDGHQLKLERFRKEKEIYSLLDKIPGLLGADTQFKPLSINVDTERGEDFIAINKKGHLIIGEIKIGPLRSGAWEQVKRYGKKIAKMHKKELESYICRDGESLEGYYKKFLSGTARKAFLNPSRRRVQLVLIAERFTDRALTKIKQQKMGGQLRQYVRDVKCVEIQRFKVDSKKTIIVSEIIMGSRRKLTG